MVALHRQFLKALAVWWALWSALSWESSSLVPSLVRSPRSMTFETTSAGWLRRGRDHPGARPHRLPTVPWPHPPVGLLQNQRHSVVKLDHHRIGLGGDDGKCPGDGAIRPPDSLPQPGKHHRLPVTSGNGIRRLGIGLMSEIGPNGTMVLIPLVSTGSPRPCRSYQSYCEGNGCIRTDMFPAHLVSELSPLFGATQLPPHRPLVRTCRVGSCWLP